MAAVMAMVVGLVIVLSLILILLAELFCSFFLHRPHPSHFKKPSSETVTNTKNHSSGTPDLRLQPPPNFNAGTSFFSQGVLHAPRSFLFPAIPDTDRDLEKQIPVAHQLFDEIPAQSSDQYFPHCPWLVQEVSPPPSAGTSSRQDGGVSRIYICNPIYDSVNEGIIDGFCKSDTPFETPDTSPSRLETDNNMGCSDCSCSSSVPATPPLTPMKRLPAEAASLPLRVASTLCTTGSDSNTNCDGNTSSSSGSPCTSPSW